MPLGFLLGFVGSTLVTAAAAALGFQAAGSAAKAAQEGTKIAETPAATLAAVSLALFAAGYLLEKRFK